MLNHIYPPRTGEIGESGENAFILKVYDKDGNLIPVYHGSMEDFTVFDITKARSYDESPD